MTHPRDRQLAPLCRPASGESLRRWRRLPALAMCSGSSCAEVNLESVHHSWHGDQVWGRSRLSWSTVARSVGLPRLWLVGSRQIRTAPALA